MRSRARGAALVLLLLATGCGGGATPRDQAHAVDLGVPDAGASAEDLGVAGDLESPADLATRDDGGEGSGDAGAGCPDLGPPAPVVTADPCDRACDRACDCSVDHCEGFIWATVGGLGATCYEFCDGRFEAAVLGAPTCADVQAELSLRDPEYAQTCASNACTQGCRRLGECIVGQCPALAPPFDEQIEADCEVGCPERSPEEMVWLLEVGCEDMVTALSADSNFARACVGGAAGCAAPETCARWAGKVTGCMAEHCGAPFAPWAEGVAQAMAGYCRDDANCPHPDDVAAQLAEEVSCDHPSLAGVGPAPPFTAMCEGTTGADAELARAVCADMIRCPGLDVLANPQLCSVYLAMQPDMLQRVNCLSAAAGACPAIFGCLEGM